jgi:hypothetical protein
MSTLTVTNNDNVTRRFRVYAVCGIKADDNTDQFSSWIDDGPSGCQRYDRRDYIVWPYGGNGQNANQRFTAATNEIYYDICAGCAITFRHRVALTEGGCGITSPDGGGMMVAHPVN